MNPLLPESFVGGAENSGELSKFRFYEDGGEWLPRRHQKGPPAWGAGRPQVTPGNQLCLWLILKKRITCQQHG